MDLRHLRTFLVLSEIKNFTKAAEQLHYAQSNVTAQIQQLEKELNVKLFERIGKSVSLTSEGEALIPYANKMLNLSKDIENRFADRSGGRVVVGASESICIYRLPEIIKSFKIEFPLVELYLHVLDTSDFMPYLESNMIDIAFVLDTDVSSPGVVKVLRMEENICVICTPDHPLAGRQEVVISDFADERLILTGKECSYRKKFEGELSEAGVVPNVVLETGSLQVIKQAVLSGLGICVLPQLAVQEELDCGALVKINYSMDYGIAAQLIHHKDKWISDSLNEFIGAVRATIC